jgi:hypothetical protein
MDRRAHQRVKVQFEAIVKNVSTGLTASGTVSDISPSGICVAMPIQLATGELITLEMADSLLSGSVAYSESENSEFRTVIEIKKVSLGTTDLSHLLQRILIDTIPCTPGLEYSETY